MKKEEEEGGGGGGWRRRRRGRTYIDVCAFVQSQAAGLAVHEEHFHDSL